MPTTTTASNYDVTKIAAGTKVMFYAGLGIPSAGARLTLHTDGTPDATTYTTAVHLGFTDKGCTLTAKGSWQKYYADDFASPIKVALDATEMSIQADLLQVEDFALMTKLTAGMGTYATGSGYKELAFGIGTVTYESVAAIWASEADSTKFCVFHIYKALNEGGIDGMNIARKGDKAIVKANFTGFDVTSRAATDTVGKYWMQT